jgi:hypothetical protein
MKTPSHTSFGIELKQNIRIGLLAGMLALMLASVPQARAQMRQAARSSDPAASALGASKADLTTEAQVRERYGKIPMSFEANQGQSDATVKFLSRGQGYSLFLTSTEAVFSLRASDGAAERNRSVQKAFMPVSLQKERAPSQYSVLRIRLEHANRGPQISGIEKLAGRSNYFVGKDPKNWHANIPTYGRIKYSGVYPGVDLVYYGNQRQLEYDFVLAPQSDPNRIELSFAGAKRLSIDGDDNLVIAIAGGQVIEHAPVIYQEIGGVRRPVKGGYELRSGDSQSSTQVTRH